MDEADRSDAGRLSRGQLIRRGGAVAVAAVAVPGLTAPPAVAADIAAGTLKALTPAEAATLEAVLERLLPTDATGPGAKEANVLRYIDWSLAGELSRCSTHRTARASWRSTRIALAHYGAAFASLTAAQQDAVLTNMQNERGNGFSPSAAAVFTMFRTHARPGHVRRPCARRQRPLRRVEARRASLDRASIVSAHDQALDVVPRNACSRPTTCRSSSTRRRIDSHDQATEAGRRRRRRPRRSGRHGRMAARRGGPRRGRDRGRSARSRSRTIPFDEIRNDMRDYMGRFKANKEVPTTRRLTPQRWPRDRSARPGPMMNAVGGTSIHWMTQSWRYLPWNFKIRSETVKRYGAGALPPGSTVTRLADQLRRSRAVVRQGRIPSRRLRRGRQHQGQDPSRGATSSKDRVLARTRILRCDAAAGTTSRLQGAQRTSARIRTPARPAIRSRGVARVRALHVLRLLRLDRMLDRGEGARPTSTSSRRPTRPGTSRSKTLRACSRSTSTDGKASGVTYLKDGNEYFQPAKAVVLSGYIVREHRVCCCSPPRRRTRTVCQTTTGRSARTTWATDSVRRRSAASSRAAG